MIYNRAGAQYTCCGVTYTIGGRVYANNESIYEGLYGVIREIRTGEDMETDNDTPDFYCDFIPPVVSDERKIIENRFTRFWRTEKRLEDLDLEMVIMDPYMLVVLDPPKNAQSLEIFLVREDWAIDDDYGTSTQIVADYHMAQFHFNNLIFQEMIDGCIQKWKHRKDLETDTHKDFYVRKLRLLPQLVPLSLLPSAPLPLSVLHFPPLIQPLSLPNPQLSYPYSPKHIRPSR